MVVLEAGHQMLVAYQELVFAGKVIMGVVIQAPATAVRVGAALVQQEVTAEAQKVATAAQGYHHQSQDLLFIMLAAAVVDMVLAQGVAEAQGAVAKAAVDQAAHLVLLIQAAVAAQRVLEHLALVAQALLFYLTANHRYLLAVV
jgi:hypothetical protein